MKFINPNSISTVVNVENQNLFQTMEVSHSPASSFNGVNQKIIPIDLSQMKEMRYTTVAPNTVIPPHAHEGPVVRIITEGEATINGKVYKIGDWILIPNGEEYGIRAGKKGYTAICIYVLC